MACSVPLHVCHKGSAIVEGGPSATVVLRAVHFLHCYGGGLDQQWRMHTTCLCYALLAAADAASAPFTVQSLAACTAHGVAQNICLAIAYFLPSHILNKGSAIVGSRHSSQSYAPRLASDFDKLFVNAYSLPVFLFASGCRDNVCRHYLVVVGAPPYCPCRVSVDSSVAITCYLPLDDLEGQCRCLQPLRCPGLCITCAMGAASIGCVAYAYYLPMFFFPSDWKGSMCSLYILVVVCISCPSTGRGQLCDMHTTAYVSLSLSLSFLAAVKYRLHVQPLLFGCSPHALPVEWRCEQLCGDGMLSAFACLSQELCHRRQWPFSHHSSQDCESHVLWVPL